LGCPAREGDADSMHRKRDVPSLTILFWGTFIPLSLHFKGFDIVFHFSKECEEYSSNLTFFVRCCLAISLHSQFQCATPSQGRESHTKRTGVLVDNFEQNH